MTWNIRPLRHWSPPAPTCSPDGSPALPTEIAPGARGPLLGIFRRLAAVLELTAPIARSAGKSERHATLCARLAIFRARVQAGDTSPLLAMALADFGEEFKEFITVELGFRRV
jgi:hypothetical protein